MENLKERYVRCVLGSQDVLGTQNAKDVCFKAVFESRGIFSKGKRAATVKRSRTQGGSSPRGLTAPMSVKASSAAARRTQSARARRSTRTESATVESRVPQLLPGNLI